MSGEKYYKYASDGLKPLQQEHRNYADYGADEKIPIDSLDIGAIKLALYYTYFVGNLAGNQREWHALTTLGEMLGFKLSEDGRILIVPDRFEVTG